MATGDRYEAETYWEELLSSDYSLSGVGHPALPVSFNAASIRAQARAAGSALDELGLGRLAGRRVLDVGSGTGAWIDFWRDRGVRDVTGMDLTETAVAGLEGRYPGVRFERGDIADWDPAERTFDLISAMNVLLHLTDDHRFAAAVANLGRALVPGGHAVVIDPVVVHRWWGLPFGPEANSRARPLADWRAALSGAGLELVSIRPVTCLLANVVDTRRPGSFRALDEYWSLLTGAIQGREWAGRAAASALEPLDRALLAVGRWAPSAKCLVARRAPTAAGPASAARSA